MAQAPRDFGLATEPKELIHHRLERYKQLNKDNAKVLEKLAERGWEFGCFPIVESDLIEAKKLLTKQPLTHWMADDCVERCTNCYNKFSMLYRRHHCRYCGTIICASCSDLPYLGQQDQEERCCKKCYNKVQCCKIITHDGSITPELKKEILRIARKMKEWPEDAAIQKLIFMAYSKIMLLTYDHSITILQDIAIFTTNPLFPNFKDFLPSSQQQIPQIVLNQVLGLLINLTVLPSGSLKSFWNDTLLTQLWNCLPMEAPLCYKAAWVLKNLSFWNINWQTFITKEMFTRLLEIVHKGNQLMRLHLLTFIANIVSAVRELHFLDSNWSLSLADYVKETFGNDGFGAHKSLMVNAIRQFKKEDNKV